MIFRIDFANPIEELAENIFENLNLTALKRFPISEHKDLIQANLQFAIKKDDASSSIEKEKSKNWIYYDINRDKQLDINKYYITIVYNKYTSFKPFKEDIFDICKSLFTECDEVNIKSIGLRYINIISIDEPNPTDWSKYLNPNLLSIFKIYPDQESITRAFQALDLRINDINLKFQYGISNRDFPAIIRKKEFILDYDARYTGLIQSYSDLQNKLEECRKPIPDLFEKSITDELRREMA